MVNKILKDETRIYEKEFLGLINEYFSSVKKRSGVETKLIDSIYELYFDTKTDNVKRKAISEFELIKEDLFKIDIFIELDKILVSDFEITANTNIDLTDLKKKYKEYPHLDTSDIVNMELSQSLNKQSNNHNTTPAKFSGREYHEKQQFNAIDFINSPPIELSG